MQGVWVDFSCKIEEFLEEGYKWVWGSILADSLKDKILPECLITLIKFAKTENILDYTIQGACPNCGSKLTTIDQSSLAENIFESCSSCGDEVIFELDSVDLMINFNLDVFQDIFQKKKILACP